MNEVAEYKPDQVDLIKRTVCSGASDDELKLFLMIAKHSGLDPFSRQIYAVMRKDKSIGKYVMTVQTSIDGFRLTAARTGQHAGTDDVEYDSEIAPNPKWARVTVYRLVAGHRVPYTAKARWEEYLPQDGFMWRKMPYLMLGKCAEALALRKAFPAELSGVYTADEMDQAENIEPATEPALRRPKCLPATEPQGSGCSNTDPVLVDGDYIFNFGPHAGTRAKSLTVDQLREQRGAAPEKSELWRGINRYVLVRAESSGDKPPEAPPAQPAKSQKEITDGNMAAFGKLHCDESSGFKGRTIASLNRDETAEYLKHVADIPLMGQHHENCVMFDAWRKENAQ